MTRKRFWVLLAVINFALIFLNAVLIYSRPQGDISAYIDPKEREGWIDGGKRVFVSTIPELRGGRVYGIGAVCGRE